MTPYTAPGIAPPVEQIIKSVCIACNTTFELLKTPTRTRNLAEARTICAGLILINHPTMTLRNIGALFNRDHSTVIYLKRMYNDLLDTDLEFQRKVAISKEFLLQNAY